MFNKSLLSLVLINTAALISCATVEKQQRTVYGSDIKPDTTIRITQDEPVSILRVATLNMAHGRKDSFNQLLVGADRHKENLDDIAEVLNRYRPNVVALQEADAESGWSGGFDHVAYLASAAEYPWRTHVSNAQSWLFSFGTALLSGVAIKETINHTFESSPPTLDKGFALAQIVWQPGKEAKPRKIDLISVHLDFSSQDVRQTQSKEMVEILSSRMNPTIIMGDFNSEWLAKESVIKELATKSRFISYRPESGDYATYKGKRLDWILITKDMEFVNYEVLPDTLSDHSMIVADIRFKDK